MATETEN